MVNALSALAFNDSPPAELIAGVFLLFYFLICIFTTR
jgi:hypothetical protein